MKNCNSVVTELSQSLFILGIRTKEMVLEMNLERLRPTVTLLALSLILISLVTGLVLWLVPGRGAFLGLSKGLYKDVHIYLSLGASVILLAHGWLNRAALSRYLGLTRAACWQAGAVTALLLAVVVGLKSF